MDYDTVWKDLYGESEWDRVNIAENVYLTKKTVAGVIQGGMDSPGHKGTILSNHPYAAIAYDPATSCWVYLAFGYTY